jgi:hypothetical protein
MIKKSNLVFQIRPYNIKRFVRFDAADIAGKKKIVSSKTDSNLISSNRARSFLKKPSYSPLKNSYYAFKFK